MLDGGISGGSIATAGFCRLESGERPLFARDVVVKDKPAPAHLDGRVGGTLEIHLAVMRGRTLEAKIEMFRFPLEIGGFSRWIVIMDDMLICRDEAGVTGEIMVGGDGFHGAISLL